MKRFYHPLTMLLFAAVALLGSNLLAQQEGDEDTPADATGAVKRIDAAYQMIFLGRETKSPEALIAGARILHKNPTYDLKVEVEGAEKAPALWPADLLEEARAMRPDDKALGTYITKVANEFKDLTRTIKGFNGGTFTVKKGVTAKHVMEFSDGGGSLSVTSVPVETTVTTIIAKKPIVTKVKKAAPLAITISGPKTISGTANPTFNADITPPAFPAGTYTLTITSATSDAIYVVTAKSAPAIVAKANLQPDSKAPLTPKIDTAGLPKITIGDDHFKIMKRDPIPFVPHELLDPKTGKKVGPNDVIVLADGTRVRAGEYYKAIDDLERRFNLHGLTLKVKGSTTTPVTTPIVDKAALEAKAAALELKHLKFDPKLHKHRLTHAEYAAAHDAAVKKGVDVPRAVAGANKSADYTRTWNFSMGNPSQLQAFLIATFEAHGNIDGIKLAGDLQAGGTLMNHRMVLLEGKGSVNAPANGKGSRATLNIYVMGSSVYSIDKSDPNFTLTKSFSKSFDYGADFHIQVGPIPVGGRIGARGSAGVDFMLSFRLTHASLHLTPHIEANAYAQVGIDLWLVSAGVGGSLLLIRDTLDLGAEVDLLFDTAARPYIQAHIYMKNTVATLDGNLYVYVRVNYLFGHHDYQWTFYHWTGYRADSYIFNDTVKVYLDK